MHYEIVVDLDLENRLNFGTGLIVDAIRMRIAKNAGRGRTLDGRHKIPINLFNIECFVIADFKGNEITVMDLQEQ